MTALNWVNDLALWLSRLVPRWVNVRITHRLVKFKFGNSIECKPGINWYWPATTDIVLVDITERSSLLSAQVIDERFLAYCFIWRITNVLPVIIKYRNAEARMESAVRNAAFRTNGNIQSIRKEIESLFGDSIELIDISAVTDTRGFVMKRFNDSATRDLD